MKGSTKKRGRTWTAYWDSPDPLTGKRKQRTKGGFRTKGDAEKHLATVVVQTNEGTYIEPSKQPLGRFMIDEWLPARADQIKPLSLIRYERVAKDIAGRPVGALPLSGVSAAHVNALYAELKAEGLAPATRRLAHAVLGRAMRDAVRWGKVARNPVTLADPPSIPRSTAKAWSERELARFLAHVQRDRLAALWRLGAMTGMRRGELLGVTWRSLDLDGARARVEQQVLPMPGVCAICGDTHSCSFGSVKRERSERSISLDATTVGGLRDRLAVQTLERELAGDAYSDHDLVFCDELGRPIRPQRLTQLCTIARKGAGLAWGSPHTLRHTHATHLLSADPPIPLHVVAARLGDDPKVVLSTYAHLLAHSDAAAAEAAADSVDKALTNMQAAEQVSAL